MGICEAGEQVPASKSMLALGLCTKDEEYAARLNEARSNVEFWSMIASGLEKHVDTKEPETILPQ